MPRRRYPRGRREVAASAGSSDTVTTPAGYTLVDSANTGATTTYIDTHTVSGSDNGVTLSYANSDAKVAALAVYSGGICERGFPRLIKCNYKTTSLRPPVSAPEYPCSC